jgi:hypothetical protein
MPLSKHCLICGGRLRALTKTDDLPDRVYHITCWKEMIHDIDKFHIVAFTKYNYEELICGKTKAEYIDSDEPFVLHFD